MDLSIKKENNRIIIDMDEDDSFLKDKVIEVLGVFCRSTFSFCTTTEAEGHIRRTEILGDKKDINWLMSFLLVAFKFELQKACPAVPVALPARPVPYAAVPDMFTEEQVKAAVDICNQRDYGPIL